MSFLAAGFLTGLVALALPWWLHRLATRDSRTRLVSSLLLLRSAEAPRERRRTLRFRALLTLRLLLLVALTLAFAQPLFERDGVAADSAPRHPMLLVMDTSASMSGSMAAARQRARALLADLPDGVAAGLVGAGSELSVLQALTVDRTRLIAAVAGVEADATRLRFDGLLGRVAAVAASLTEEPLEIHLISDFQASAVPDRFNALVADSDASVTLHAVGGSEDNWQLTGRWLGGRLELTVRSHAAVARTLSVGVEGDAEEIERRTLSLDPGESVAVAVPVEDATWLRAFIDGGDGMPFDDVVHVAVPQPAALALPVFEGTGAQSQAGYLLAAVAAVAPAFQPGPSSLRGPVAVALDGGGLSDSDSRRLQRHLADGGGVLMTVGPGTRRLGVLPASGTGLAGRTLDSAGTGRRVISVDDRHPALAGTSGWRDIRVFRHLAVAPGPATELLTLEDGTGLLLEYPVGAGRVLALTTALDPDWTSLVTAPAFVEFVGGALEYLAQEKLPLAAVAGEPLALPASGAQLFDQRGVRMLALADTTIPRRVRVARPGIYTVRTPNRERLLAVNPDLRESAPARVDAELLARWQDALDSSRAPDRVPDVDRAGIAAGPMALAPWLLALLLLLCAVEPVTANAGALRGWVQRTPRAAS